MHPQLRLYPLSWLTVVLTFLLAATLLAFYSTDAQAQGGSGQITLVKDATPADGTNFGFGTSFNFLGKWGTNGSGDGQFSTPQGVAVDASGNVYVADEFNHRIQKFSSSGIFLTKWGTNGSGDGQFSFPVAVAVDASGNVYVADLSNHRIQKFNSSGVFLTKWGAFGSGDGQFNSPEGVMVDGSGNVYVADALNHRIQKFSSSGVFLTQWGAFGTGDGQFSFPAAVAVDASGNVYVADTSNDRIQKFSSSGVFLTKWGTVGSGDGQFIFPVGVAVDATGNVYVADELNNRIQKFTSSGLFLAKWGTNGSGNGQFDSPGGVAVDASGSVYVADSDNNRIQRFLAGAVLLDDAAPNDGDAYTSIAVINAIPAGTYAFTESLPSGWALNDISCSNPAGSRNGNSVAITLVAGQHITCTFNNVATQLTLVKDALPADGTDFGFDILAARWGALGSGDGQFNSPRGVAVDTSGQVYVADFSNNRIQKFTRNGVFSSKWGASGSGDGQFSTPFGVAVDASGNVYVADSGNSRIQMFSGSGVFLTKWGTNGSGDGQLNIPQGVAVDASGNVYVADTFNSRIQKFSSSGIFLSKWGTNGSGDGQFSDPVGVAVDASGNVYVADQNNHRIQKFSSVGVFIGKWGTLGSGDGQFSSPVGVAVGASGAVYVADTFNNRIQKFTASGGFLAKWGTTGSGNGQFNLPRGLAVDANGTVYIADSDNNRIQRFLAGGLILDDAAPDDADAYSSATTISKVPSGVYTITESGPSVWTLQSASCPDGASVQSGNQVAVTLNAGQHITCTLTNAGPATLTLVKDATPATGTNFDFTPGFKFLNKWGVTGAGDGQFNSPRGVAVDASGIVYVADTDSNRIQKFSSGGSFLTKWGTAGSGNGQFNNPLGVAAAASGFVYVADTGNNRIQQFSSNGAYQGQWGALGGGDGQFNQPSGAAVDAIGNVYVADRGNQRIQMFTSSGVFVTKWGTAGSGDGQFSNPFGVTVDALGSVYVADFGNNRIQKFTSSGIFVTKWGTSGSANGQLSSPTGVAVDASGNVYVADFGNKRIQKFSSSGVFLSKWGTTGAGDEQFNAPQNVAVDRRGNVYVVDGNNNRIQRFLAGGITLDDALPNDGDAYTSTVVINALPVGTYVFTESLPSGWVLNDIACNNAVGVRSGNSLAVTLTANQQITCTFSNVGTQLTLVKDATPADGTDFGFEILAAKWGMIGSGDGQFNNPWGVVVDASGSVYVAEFGNNRIQKFTSSGVFVTKWGTLGSADGQLSSPTGVAVDASGNVYVADSGNNRIQKFTSSGSFLAKWGTVGSGDGQFNNPRALTVDASGNVYVADANNNRIQKFSSSGVFLTKWGAFGSTDGQFNNPGGVVVDASGNVYVADTFNNRIQKFNSNGTFITKWGAFGSGDGQFTFPVGVAVDASGNVYVTDTSNHRIQKFSSSGLFLAKWGKLGSGDGQFNIPQGVAVDGSGNIYVADTNNHRIQRFLADGITLDDALPDDGDAYTTTTTISNVAPGVYTIIEFGPPLWVLQSASCPDGASVQSGNQVAVTLTAGQHITCTMTNAGPASLTLVKDAAPADGANFGFTVGFKFLDKWGAQGSKVGQFSSPAGVAVDASGNVYVADTFNYRIQKFNRGGVFLTKWGAGGSSDGQFNVPNDVAVDANGNVYVADANNNRIQKFSSSGTFLTKWGTLGSSDGRFSNPVGVAVDASGNVYVADSGNHRIQKFTSSGSFLAKWGANGSGNGQFNFPVDVAVDASGNVFVADFSNRRVQKFSTNGVFVAKWGTFGSGDGQFINLSSVAVDASGNVFVADTNNHRIQQFTNNGGFIRAWGTQGSGDGQFSSPLGVAVDASGNVFVADTSNDRIQRFLAGGITLDDALPDDGDAYTNTAVINALPVGTYAFTESLPGGWVLNDISCSNAAGVRSGNSLAVTLTAGQQGTCTFTNVAITQTLTVGKVVVGGGPLNASNFALFVDGNPVTRNTPTLFVSGLHTVTEASDPRYTASFGGACDSSGKVTLGIGDDLTCTMTNTYITQTLTVQKVVTGGGPLSANDFPLFINGSPVTRGAANLLENGLYTVTETGDTRYIGSFGAACDNSGKVTLGIGDDLTCTITNTYITQTLTVQKVVVGGGPLSADNFSLFIDGNNVTRGAPNLLANGVHSITETNDPRYTASIGGACNSSGEVTLGIGDDLTCTITNTYITQTLTVQKVVAGGGPLTANDFPLFVNGNSVTRGAANLLINGVYTVTETGDPLYAASFGGACNSSGKVTLGIGQDLTCTITNTYLTQTLTVQKVVMGGGPLTANDFPLFINSSPVTRGAANLLANGVYTVTETGDLLYAASFGGACNSSGKVTLGIGQNLTCTITNSYITQTLTVQKVVAGGGPLSANDFPLFINGNGVTHAVANLLANGVYTVTESGDPRYAASFGGACNSGGKVTLGIGDDLTCIITNSYITQTLTVQKVVAGGGPLDADDFPLFINEDSVMRGAANLLANGVFTVTESGDPRYVASFGGACDSNGKVTLGIGDDLTCTLTNTYITQTLTVQKVVVGGGPLAANDFPLFVNGNSVTRGIANLLANGVYTVTETGDPRYTASFGGNCDSNGTVTLGIGQNLVCTITNTLLAVQPELAHLTVIVTVTGQPPATAWNLTLSGATGAFTLPVAGGNRLFDLEAGDYALNAMAQAGFAISVGCSNGVQGTNQAALTLVAGAQVTCTITNTRLPSSSAAIVVSKTVGLQPDVCAATDVITAPVGTTVYYCVTVRNTGDVTLTKHTLVDDKLGVFDFEALLAPDAELNTINAGVIMQAEPQLSVTNVVTWTASNELQTAQATAQATVRIAQAVITVAKTVGTLTDGCSTTTTLHVDQDTPVFFCVTVLNTGEVPLDRLTVVDAPLGIEETLNVTLTPHAEIVLTQLQLAGLGPVTASADITNTVTVTASAGAGEIPLFVVTASATANVIAEVGEPTGETPPRLRLPFVRH